MNFLLFLPETFLLLMALIFFCQSLWKSSAKLNQGIAFFLSALGVIISLLSLNSSGDLFYKAYRVDLFSQTLNVLISLGLFLVIVLGRKLKKHRGTSSTGIFHVSFFKFPGPDVDGQQCGAFDHFYRHGAVLLIPSMS